MKRTAGTYLDAFIQGLKTRAFVFSPYFKQHRLQYYDCLQRVRTEGDWGDWLTIYFTGVADTAQSAVTGAKRLLALFAHDRERLRRSRQSGQDHPVQPFPEAAGSGRP